MSELSVEQAAVALYAQPETRSIAAARRELTCEPRICVACGKTFVQIGDDRRRPDGDARREERVVVAQCRADPADGGFVDSRR